MVREGLPIAWEVFPKYTIDGDRVFPVGIKNKEARAQQPRDAGINFADVLLYAPAERPELPSEIAKLKRGDEASVIRFAERYGLLGYSHLAPFAPNSPYGDPPSWVWRHAETLDLCLSLKEFLDDDDTDGIEGRLRAYPRLWKSSVHLSPIIPFGVRDKIYKSTFHPAPASSWEEALRNLAALILRKIVNDNIAALHQVIGWSPGDKSFRQHLGATALIEVAYWHVANALLGGVLKKCELSECGRLFIQTDRRQRYCPTGTKDESPCARRDRVRSWRVKQRLKAKKGNVSGTTQPPRAVRTRPTTKKGSRR